MEEKLKRSILFNAMRSYYVEQGMSPHSDFIKNQVDLWMKGVRDHRIHDDMYKLHSLLSQLCDNY